MFTTRLFIAQWCGAWCHLRVQTAQESDRLTAQIHSALEKVVAHQENVKQIIAGAENQFTQGVKTAEGALNFLPPSLLQE